ncbi:MAG: MBL fold metallo-hydrolase [Alphaproteobacteria bacterium]|nr:MBL fold metallo-hydrolase [Alphaproteobacteria bacterium]
MNRFALTLVGGMSLAWVSLAAAQSPPADPYPVIQGKTYRFEKIADGVYYATGGFGSNNVVIVNDADVLIVDTGTTPAAARAFIADIKMLTDKPVRFVVNTHWHFDHTDGNSVFGPDVQIIANDYVRTAITTFDVLHREPYLTSEGSAVPAQIEDLGEQAAAERDPDRKAQLQQRLYAAQQVLVQLKDIKPTPPNVTYSDKLILHRGGREIDLLFLGRGHTAGDTVVWLPKERIVCSGDLMESRIAYMGDGYFDEWVATLDKLKNLDFAVDLPGHGVPFSDKNMITEFQSYLKDLVAQVSALKAQGVSPDEAAQRVNLTAHAKYFPQITGPGADLRGVRRVYAWLDERDKK